MNTPSTIEQPQVAHPLGLRSDEIIYPESHDDDMGETTLHYRLASYLFGALFSFFSTEPDVAIAANLNLYFEEGNSRKYVSPDVLVAFGVSKRDRSVYKVWEEGVFPQVVFEVASDRTWKNDIGDKAEFYGEAGVEEYYLLDSERRYLPMPLMAYRRIDGRLQFIPLENNRIFSPSLNLEIVDTGKSYRLYDPAKHEFLQAILTGEE